MCKDKPKEEDMVAVLFGSFKYQCYHIFFLTFITNNIKINRHEIIMINPTVHVSTPFGTFMRMKSIPANFEIANIHPSFDTSIVNT